MFDHVVADEDDAVEPVQYHTYLCGRVPAIVTTFGLEVSSATALWMPLSSHVAGMKALEMWI